MAKEGQAKVFDPFSQFLDIVPWVSKDAFTVGGDSGYAVDILHPQVRLRTGTSQNCDSYIYSKENWYAILEAGKAVTVEFIVHLLSYLTYQNIWIRAAATVNDPPGETDEHFGWKIIGADLYASNANDSAQTITDTGIDLTADYVLTRLKMVFTPGTGIKFYVNGVLKATQTTNLPLQAVFGLHFHVRTLTNSLREIYLGRVLIQKAYA